MVASRVASVHSGESGVSVNSDDSVNSVDCVDSVDSVDSGNSVGWLEESLGDFLVVVLVAVWAVNWAGFVVDVFNDWLVGGFDVSLNGWNGDVLLVDGWSHDSLVAGAGVGKNSLWWDASWETDGWLNLDWGLDVGGLDWDTLVDGWSGVGQNDWVFALGDDVSGVSGWGGNTGGTRGARSARNSRDSRDARDARNARDSRNSRNSNDSLLAGGDAVGGEVTASKAGGLKTKAAA